MSNLAELKGRMTEAVERLSDAEAGRRHSNEALARLLGDLEDKYRARDEELHYCARRIDSLSAENRELGDLLERLLGIIEGAFARGADDPVYQASAMASELLAGWREEAAARAPAPIAAAEPPGRFEDVSEAELAAELADELIDARNAGELPPPLIEASAIHHAMSFPGGLVSPPELPAPVDAAASIIEDTTPSADEEELIDDFILVDDTAEADPFETGEQPFDAALGADIEIPEINRADDAAPGAAGAREDTRDPEASIRAMMERLERVEERARAQDQK